MIKVVVTGAAGRMGSRIIALAQGDKELKIVGAIEAPGSKTLGQEVGGGVKISDSVEQALSMADVLIDFSHAEATLGNLEIVAAKKKAAVIGTTGHSEEQKKGIVALASKIPIVMASNMSVGVNVMWKIIAEAAKALGQGFPVSVKEVHHIHKKDKPSGTALEMIRVLSEALRLPADRIPVESIREGEVVGDHTAVFEGEGERLEITHHASSRDTFAQGALRAAQWVVGKKPGLYSMRDLLGL